MPNIYESNNLYYIKENNLYRLYDISIKRTTIVLMPTDIYKEELENATEYTYAELRNKIIGGNENE